MGFQVELLVLFSMFFCHIVDDYYLQGILASMKQKKWWETNANEDFYKHDYKIALAEHGFSWAFVVSIPILITYFSTNNTEYIWVVLILISFNSFFHAYIDDAKANKHIINLICDQTFHFAQIICTWFICVIVCL